MPEPASNLGLILWAVLLVLIAVFGVYWERRQRP